MLLVQFVFSLVLILIAPVIALGVIAICWLVLVAVRSLPLVGRRHRHLQWSEVNRIPPRP